MSTLNSVPVAPSQLSAVANYILLCAQTVFQPSLLTLVHSTLALSGAQPSPQLQLCWSADPLNP